MFRATFDGFDPRLRARFEPPNGQLLDPFEQESRKNVSVGKSKENDGLCAEAGLKLAFVSASATTM
jgi:hypothetical protein